MLPQSSGTRLSIWAEGKGKIKLVLVSSWLWRPGSPTNTDGHETAQQCSLWSQGHVDATEDGEFIRAKTKQNSTHIHIFNVAPKGFLLWTSATEAYGLKKQSSGQAGLRTPRQGCESHGTCSSSPHPSSDPLDTPPPHCAPLASSLYCHMVPHYKDTEDTGPPDHCTGGCNLSFGSFDDEFTQENQLTAPAPGPTGKYDRDWAELAKITTKPAPSSRYWWEQRCHPTSKDIQALCPLSPPPPPANFERIQLLGFGIKMLSPSHPENAPRATRRTNVEPRETGRLVLQPLGFVPPSHFARSCFLPANKSLRGRPKCTQTQIRAKNLELRPLGLGRNGDAQLPTLPNPALLIRIQCKSGAAPLTRAGVGGPRLQAVLAPRLRHLRLMPYWAHPGGASPATRGEGATRDLFLPGSTLKKLLHTGNSIKIRCEGIRLFLLWLQALQTNCAEEQVLIFACLVPGFPAILSSRGPCTLETLINPSPSVADAKIYPEEITPLLPAISGEKTAEDQTCFFLQILLKYTVIQAASLEWKNKENQDTGFKFLFTLFRKYYLPHLFPSFTKLTNIYKPVLDIPHWRPKPLYITTTRDSESIYSTKIPYMAARVVFIKWIVTFFLEKYLTATQSTKNGVDVLPKIIQTVGGGAEPERVPELDGSGPLEQEKGYSNSSALSERRLSSSSLCSIEEEHRTVYGMVRQILLSTRGYVNFVNEVFRQAFLLPSCEIAITRKVVQVYRKWILQEKPVFMEEPDKNNIAQEDAEKLGVSEIDAKEASLDGSGHKRSSSWGRTYSFTSAMSRGCVAEEDSTSVKAGSQAVLQVFLTNAANVFLLEPCVEVPVLLKEQVDACKAVLIIFRRMIMELTMNKKTWEQMLQILLRITEAVMQKPKDKQIKDLFAQSLAGLLFRTLIVAWIRANLCVFISRELWDNFLGVLSSLTEWEELISEWANIMDSLTAVLARTVYGVEMTNLPLDKLSEQKEKKQRGKGRPSETLIVAWIRANLCVFISRELWDNFLGVLSSLTEWEELISEWANIMDSLTAVLARTVYGVEMTNLPLDKLSEQKEKKQRGKGCVLDSQKGTTVGRSFSLSWRSHPDVTEPMRFRSATTSGAPGVEKARNNVRQKATEVEENPQSENTPAAEPTQLTMGQQQVLQSSSTSDIPEPRIPEASQGQKVEFAQNLTSSEPKPSQENTGQVKREHEGITILVRRSSSPAELDLQDDLQQTQGFFSSVEGAFRDLLSEWRAADQKAGLGAVGSRLRKQAEGESASGDTALGYNSEAELLVTPWQACEEDPDLSTPTDAVADSDARQWLQLSPTDTSNLTDNSECLVDDCSIIAGGNLTGWHPDSAAVLWRRILGILGDVNNIQSPKIHAKVFGYLYELWYKLAKATTLPNKYKEGKLQAYRLICAMMTRRQDVLPNSDFLVHFYLAMHLGLTSEDQDILNTIIRHCPPRFFSLGLPGFSMLVGDFITASARVLGTDMLVAPRSEALTILGSLVCFPNIYQEIPLLPSVPEVSEVVTGTEDVKHYLINILLKNATEEPNECARCIAICSLGVWICEELMQRTWHPQVKEAINVVGVTLKFPNKIVAQVACDVLQLLVSYWEKLQLFETSLPRKMAEILVATIAFLLPSAEYSSVEADKKFIVSLLLCLLDWCMALPVSALLHPVSTSVLEEQHLSQAPLLDYIYRVLHCCVCGSSTYTQQSHYTLTLADLSSVDYDPFLPLASVRSSEPVQCHSSADLDNLLTVEEERRRRSLELIPLTARMVMAHLVNHLGHYPLAGGPAVLHSLVSENHDNTHTEGAELSPDVFRSPNLQLFVFNDSTLISYLQMPAEGMGGTSPGDAVSDVRVIVRDVSGKYSWDGKVLYGPSEGCPAPSGYSSTFQIPSYHSQSVGPQKDLPQIQEGDDVLDKLLENIGYTSPECLLPSQLKLNEPSPPPYGMNSEQEKEIIKVILCQNAQEDEHVQRCNSASTMKVTSQGQPSPVEPRGPFYFCRLLLDDLGMNSWDRRKNFHLLKKNSKLLRELKNLDSRQCMDMSLHDSWGPHLLWRSQVDLSTHCGFMGGLQRNGSTGQTAPYYATSTVEVIFHVSTRMPSDSDDSLTKKLRHLGNDEVHIVWSEHSRDYRRGIIPTAFGDVSIIIYPMKNHMFFITITKKPEVPFFGPLFDGAIVSGNLLPSLICATCINASRAVKCLIPLYQNLYLFALHVPLTSPPSTQIPGSVSCEVPGQCFGDSLGPLSVWPLQPTLRFLLGRLWNWRGSRVCAAAVGARAGAAEIIAARNPSGDCRDFQESAATGDSGAEKRTVPFGDASGESLAPPPAVPFCCRPLSWFKKSPQPRPSVPESIDPATLNASPSQACDQDREGQSGSCFVFAGMRGWGVPGHARDTRRPAAPPGHSGPPAPGLAFVWRISIKLPRNLRSNNSTQKKSA
ncbi:250 kDa substrate of Akt [Heterocephalus glaber]|uniref:250 kDa substrate of Akt n=1 Tax=Heterocephalus glaber TaxID=10181 RepID=G5CBC1_HETGA|nr:250 kDa substrate of Akt [Heterocephalus glaber]